VNHENQGNEKGKKRRRMKERKMDWRGHIEPPYETHVTL
jgi:hypothetical protein